MKRQKNENPERQKSTLPGFSVRLGRQKTRFVGSISAVGSSNPPLSPFGKGGRQGG
jgi:hypothetical protein